MDKYLNWILNSNMTDNHKDELYDYIIELRNRIKELEIGERTCSNCSAGHTRSHSCCESCDGNHSEWEKRQGV